MSTFDAQRKLVKEAQQLIWALEDKQSMLIQNNVVEFSESDDDSIIRLDFLITSAYQRLARRESAIPV